MKLIVLSLRRAEQFIPRYDERTVCISITAPGTSLPILSEDFMDVLFIQFHDTDREVTGWTHCAPEHAKAIADFICKHKDADVLVIHCHAGMSRSVGVAAAILECSQDFRMPLSFQHANSLVWRVVWQELNKSNFSCRVGQIIHVPM